MSEIELDFSIFNANTFSIYVIFFLSLFELVIFTTHLKEGRVMLSKEQEAEGSEY